MLCLLRLSDDEPSQVSMLLPIAQVSSTSGESSGLDLLLQPTPLLSSPPTGSEDDWLALAAALMKKLLMVFLMPVLAESPFLIPVAVAVAVAMEMECTLVVMSGLLGMITADHDRSKASRHA